MKNQGIQYPAFAALFIFAALFFFQTSLAFAGDANDIIDNMEVSVSLLPGLITASSYLLALLFGVLGILKIRDHVENPNQTPLREGLIRFIAGGALVALPILYDAMETTINGGLPMVFDQTRSGTTLVDRLSIGGMTALIQPFDFDDILRSIIDTSNQLPGLATGLSYLLGLIFGVAGVLKLKSHVENPTQTPMKEGIIRLLVGGALFALPTVFDAAYASITGTNTTLFSPSDTLSGSIVGVIGGLIGSLGIGINGVLVNITSSIEEAPGFITAVAYLAGILFVIIGILKIKEHVDNPTQAPMKDGIIYLLIGGAFFAIPVVYQAMYETLGGDAGVLASIASLFGAGAWLWSADAGGFQCGGIIVDRDLGSVLCNLMAFNAAWPGFLKAMAYLFGLVLGFWGLIKIKNHVLNPAQTPLSEGVSRLIAGGAFFALPLIIETARISITPALVTVLSTITVNTGFNGNPTCTLGGGGLDNALNCLMESVFGALPVAMNFFGFVAGTILIMIGISRLIKTAQDGPRGPGGLGTMMTFLAGGALISFNPLIRTFTASLFAYDGWGAAGITRTNAVLVYTNGMSPTEIVHAHTVISAILKFMILVGLISFVRGIFIVRNVAEGNQQASIMAGVTHLLGGALAVNLGPLLGAVQNTLGISAYGIVFS